MPFTFYFFVAWFVVFGFLAMRKPLTSMESSFLYLVLLIISVNWYWVIFEEMKFTKVTQEPLLFTAFLINRSITVPLLVVVAINGAQRSASKAVYILWPILTISILTGLSWLGRYMNITLVARGWNVGYDILFFSFLHVVAYYSLKLFRSFAPKRRAV